MTPRERIKAVFRRTPVDRVPSYPILGAYTTRLTGSPVAEYFTSAAALVAGQLAALDAYRPDVLVVVRDLAGEAEALGAAVRIDQRGHVHVTRHPLADDPGLLAEWSQPDLRSAGRMPAYWQACTELAAQAREVPVGSLLVGPWTLACHLRGLENLVRDAVRRPDFVHDLLAFTLEVAVQAAGIARSCGVGAGFTEPAASASVVSPRLYRHHIAPVHRQLTSRLAAERNAPTLHICGRLDPILDEVLGTGLGALSIDRETSLELALERSQGSTVIIGNVAVQAFVEGGPDAVEAELRRVVAAVRGHPAVIASACEIPLAADPAAVLRFAQLAKVLGVPDAPDQARCTSPEVVAAQCPCPTHPIPDGRQLQP